jgi:transposase
MNLRYYSLKESVFIKQVEPYIKTHYKRPGRPAELSHYQFFCGVSYVLRTGISWRDLPESYGKGHTLYTRFKRWSENGLFWDLVYQLHQAKKLTVDISWVDSTTIPIHRHGVGALKKKGHNPLVVEAKAYEQKYI